MMESYTPYFHKMMESAVQIQSHVAEILEAKANEAEQSKRWICAQTEHENPIKHCMRFHGQIVEMIEGITKFQTAMNRNLKALLGSEQSGSFDMKELFSDGGTDDND